jgi:hypothetical protein
MKLIAQIPGCKRSLPVTACNLYNSCLIIVALACTFDFYYTLKFYRLFCVPLYECS